MCSSLASAHVGEQALNGQVHVAIALLQHLQVLEILSRGSIAGWRHGDSDNSIMKTRREGIDATDAAKKGDSGGNLIVGNLGPVVDGSSQESVHTVRYPSKGLFWPGVGIVAAAEGG